MRLGATVAVNDRDWASFGGRRQPIRGHRLQCRRRHPGRRAISPKFPPSRLVNALYQVVEPLITKLT